jgi:hypothetical protein
MDRRRGNESGGETRESDGDKPQEPHVCSTAVMPTAAAQTLVCAEASPSSRQWQFPPCRPRSIVRSADRGRPLALRLDGNSRQNGIEQVVGSIPPGSAT